jgi:hypothetical protein
MSVKLVAVWICFSYATGSHPSFHASNSGEVEDSVGHMTKHIVESHFAHSYCVGIIVEYGQLLRYILTTTAIVLVTVSTVPQMMDSEEFETIQEETKAFDKIMVTLLDQGCSSFIIQVTNPELLVKYFYRSSRRSGSRSNKRYLYLPPLESFESKNYDASHIFKMKEMAVMPDLVVVKLVRKDELKQETCSSKNAAADADGMEQIQHINISEDIPYVGPSDPCLSGVHRQRREGIACYKDSCPSWHEIQIVTHRFVGSSPDTEVWLDTWVCGRGFLKGVDLYPNKMRNLHGKMIHVAAVPNYPPYTIVYTNSTPPVYDGIELRFVKDFARYLNFTFGVITDDAGWWGEVSRLCKCIARTN